MRFLINDNKPLGVTSNVRRDIVGTFLSHLWLLSPSFTGGNWHGNKAIRFLLSQKFLHISCVNGKSPSRFFFLNVFIASICNMKMFLFLFIFHLICYSWNSLSYLFWGLLSRFSRITVNKWISDSCYLILTLRLLLLLFF